ncbi:hypothetical protein LEP1GSC060_3470 [Leptospira weilii serovar Ranarum str. ICFT]|uniref:Uncharacterized protein n=1 Tax=Leptospira weilii serovar Ranarum str. ICFT TaxID=1218598 RepID=N1WI55_9LEPT|nr:hypothetical protein LEP1GSC060_3470 [Leptospira weilii serovar Ranarum str. ICFT]
MEMSCFTKEEVQIPIDFVNLQKGKSFKDSNEDTEFTNVIGRA